MVKAEIKTHTYDFVSEQLVNTYSSSALLTTNRVTLNHTSNISCIDISSARLNELVRDTSFTMTVTFSGVSATSNCKSVGGIEPIFYSFNGIEWRLINIVDLSEKVVDFILYADDSVDYSKIFFKTEGTKTITCNDINTNLSCTFYTDVKVSFSYDYDFPIEIEVDSALLENVYKVGSSPEVDESKASLVLKKRYDDVLLSRRFRLGYDSTTGKGTYYDESTTGEYIGSSTTSGTSISGSTTGNYSESETHSGTVTYSSTVDEFYYDESGGTSNYTVNVSFASTFPLGTTLDPTHLYYFDFDFNDVNIYKDVPEASTVYYTSADSYILVQGEKFECGDLWSTDFMKHTTNASEFQYVVKLSFLITVYDTSDVLETDFYELGILLDNPSITVYDYGVYDRTDEVIGEIGKGNESQEKGNELQEEQNELQKEQNETTSNIFDSISDFFGSFFENLIGIFVPEDGYFEDFFQRLNDFFSEKLGMLYAPVDIFIDILTAISSGSGSTGITFPEVKWEEYVLIEQQTIDLQSIAGELGDLQDYIYLGTNIIMVGSVFGLLQDKLGEMLKT